MTMRRKDPPPPNPSAVREITTGMTIPAHIAYQMTIVANLMAFAGNQANVEQFGLNFRQWRVIGSLGRTGPLTASEIVEVVHQDKSSVSRAVAELSARRLLRKQQNARHRGSPILVLTEAGRALYEQILPVWEAQAAENVACLSDGEQRLMCELLDRMKPHLERVRRQRVAD
jgi:DNA-binding MarR family transcriptional regulator